MVSGLREVRNPNGWEMSGQVGDALKLSRFILGKTRGTEESTEEQSRARLSRRARSSYRKAVLWARNVQKRPYPCHSVDDSVAVAVQWLYCLQCLVTRHWTRLATSSADSLSTSRKTYTTALGDILGSNSDEAWGSSTRSKVA